MAEDPCLMIARNLANLLDGERAKKSDFEIDKLRASQPRDSLWNGIQGDSVRALGGGFAEMSGNGWVAMKDFLRRLGPIGAEVSSKIDGMLLATRINTSLDIMRVRPFLQNLNKMEKLNLVEVMEQRSQTTLENGLLEPVGSRAIDPMNGRVEVAVSKMREYFRDIATQANDRGILNGYIENYWPHLRETKLLDDPKFRSKAEEALAWQTAVFRTAREQDISPYSVKRADVKVEYIDRAYAHDNYDSYLTPQLARIAPNLEKIRALDIPGYELEPMNVLRRYSQSVRHRFAEHDIWGERRTPSAFPDTVDKQFEMLGVGAPDETNRLEWIKQHAFGYSPADPMSPWLQWPAKIQALKMSMSVLSNMFQPVNTGMRTNVRSFAKGWVDLIGDREIAEGVGARDFALMAGVAADNVLHDAALYQGGGWGDAVLRYTGFTGIEKLNRMHAAVTGAQYTRQMYDAALGGSKRASQRLRELGWDAHQIRDEFGDLTFEHLLVGARRVVDETQFITNFMEMPRGTFLQGPNAKLIMQFKTFAYNQSRLMARTMHQRPARALLFALGAMPAVGAISTLLKTGASDLISGGDQFEKFTNLEPYEMYIRSLAAGASFGLASDMLWNMYSGIDAGRPSWQIAQDMFTPPAMSSMIDAVSIPMDVVRGREDNAIRTFGRNFGGVGAAFARRIAPPPRR